MRWVFGNIAFTLSMQKAVAENLVVDKYKILTSKGIDQGALNAFFSNPNPISETINNAHYGLSFTARKDDSIAKANKISINPKGEVFKNDSLIGMVKINQISIPGASFGGITQSEYDVFDIHNNKIAYLIPSSNGLADTIITYNKNKLAIKRLDAAEKLPNDIVAQQLIKKLYANNYTLGNQYKLLQAQEQLNNEKKLDSLIAQADVLLGNIHKLDGYVIDEKGNKLSGKLSIDFASPTAALDLDKNIVDLNSYGKTVTLATLNQKGKTVRDNYKSKDGISFCVQRNGTEECYVGLNTIGDWTVHRNEITIKLDYSKFYKIYKNINGILILQDPNNANNFYLKLKNQPKAYFLDAKFFTLSKKAGAEKSKEKFDDYIQCPAIQMDQYNLRDLKSVEKLINDYSAACVK